MTSRELAPVVPLYVTQANCLASFGLKPRRFLELVRELRVPTREIGKLRGVEASALLEALRPVAKATPANETQQERLERAAGLR